MSDKRRCLLFNQTEETENMKYLGQINTDEEVIFTFGGNSLIELEASFKSKMEAYIAKVAKEKTKK